ncbi:SANT/Myb domain [Macleaya cordata]|uniref:SANT/Myb domain n=1 Tax=Macleaya cordata TaxID=56857 RepID=A0A200QYP3_MACCD|nr:SANT/Myb domain [Macleaya cordata]
MGEEVQMIDQGGGGGGDEERVLEWEAGLPNADDLTPLSQPLISAELASAFSISPETYRTITDVNRASQNTLSNLRRQNQDFPTNHLKSLPSFTEDPIRDQEIVDEEDEEDEPETRKVRRTETTEEAYSTDDQSARTLKRPRLVWTPQLHKRFVDVVGHLGIKNAVPKTIMQLMNVEGLTRENVASHLQKYRLYLKRMQGLSNEGPSSSDPLFATTPVPQSLNESGGQGHVPLHPMPYGAPMMSMPVLGMSHGHHGHMGMPMGNPAYHGFESQQYNMYREQQRDWSGNTFNSIASYPNVNQNDK